MPSRETVIPTNRYNKGAPPEDTDSIFGLSIDYGSKRHENNSQENQAKNNTRKPANKVSSNNFTLFSNTVRYALYVPELRVQKVYS